MAKRGLGWLTERPIAHRGYHDGNIRRYENSMSAFRAALERGFAIECDVHPTAEGNVVVFHDDDLYRLTGTEGSVRGRSIAELQTLRLGTTNEAPPALLELIDLVDGSVSLIIEMKGPATEGFADAVRRTVEHRSGQIAVMSFDHDLVRPLIGSGIPVGLTAEGTTEDQLRLHRSIASEVDFLSYSVADIPNEFVSEFRATGRPVITWTVRTTEQRERTFAHADQMTFEGFDPRTGNVPH